MVVLEDGSMIEASTIGNEGMDGLYLMADPLANPYRINVQVQGDMLCMSASAFRRALSESHALTQLLLRYAMVLIQRVLKMERAFNTTRSRNECADGCLKRLTARGKIISA